MAGSEPLVTIVYSILSYGFARAKRGHGLGGYGLSSFVGTSVIVETEPIEVWPPAFLHLLHLVRLIVVVFDDAHRRVDAL